MYLLGGLGASLGYHRILTHGSAKLPKWLEYSIVSLGLPAGTPVQWAGNHRAHHKFTDVDGDPHSPNLDGFWYAHCGWYIGTKRALPCALYALAGPIRMLIDGYMRPRTNQEHTKYAKDIASDPFYAFVSRPWIYTILVWLYLFVVLFLPCTLFGWQGLLASSITLIVIYNIGDAVDSFGHLYGEKHARSAARNNWILGILAFGDGWHANHHDKPKCARHGTKRGQLDASYLLLKGLKRIGLVKKIY